MTAGARLRMTPKAILFGSVGVLAETAALQRQAFDRAFAENGLDWPWDDADGRALLNQPGGAARIAAQAERQGARVDAVAILARKEALFQALLRVGTLPRRPGIDEVVAAAGWAGVRLAFATSAERRTVDALLAATRLAPETFEFIADRSLVDANKPAPDVYLATLAALGLGPGDVIAIEDTPECAEAALAARIACVAFPGSLHVGRRFGDVIAQVQVLAPRLFGLEDAPARAAASG